MCSSSGMASNPTHRVSSLSRSLSLVYKIPLSSFGSSETNTIGYYGGQRRLGWCKDDVRRQLHKIAQTSTYQEPAAPGGLPRRGQGKPPPVIPAETFSPVAGTQPGPAVRHLRRQEAFALVLAAGPPDVFLAREGHDRGVVLLFPSHP